MSAVHGAPGSLFLWGDDANQETICQGQRARLKGFPSPPERALMRERDAFVVAEVVVEEQCGLRSLCWDCYNQWAELKRATAATT